MICLAMAAILAGCEQSRDAQGLPKGLVSYQEVTRHAEAHLYYPGSTVLRTDGKGEDSRGGFAEGHRPAFTQTYLAVEGASAREIAGWYAADLSRRGWVPDAVDRQPLFRFTRGRRESFDVWVDIRAPDATAYTGPGIVYLISYQIASCAGPGPAVC